MTGANLSQLKSIKRYRDKPENRIHHNEVGKVWRKNNPDKVKEYTKYNNKKYTIRKKAEEKLDIMLNSACSGFCEFEPI